MRNDSVQTRSSKHLDRTASESMRQRHADRVQWLRTRPGEQCLIRESSEDTNGLYAVLEIVSSPGDGTPLHLFLISPGGREEALHSRTKRAAVVLSTAEGQCTNRYRSEAITSLATFRWSTRAVTLRLGSSRSPSPTRSEPH